MGKPFASERVGRQYGAGITEAVLLAPAADGATWPNCGHPKTDQNTKKRRQGDRCRICNRRYMLSSIRNKRQEGAVAFIELEHRQCKGAYLKE